jgi:hypothetical protein
VPDGTPRIAARPTGATCGALVEPLIPPARRGGRKRTVNAREVLNAVKSEHRWILTRRAAAEAMR